jgi:hypothetical protein
MAGLTWMSNGGYPQFLGQSSLLEGILFYNMCKPLLVAEHRFTVASGHVG